MPYLQPGDPAEALWRRIDEQDIRSMAPLLDNSPIPIGKIAESLSLEVISITLPSDISGLIKQVSATENRFQIQVNNTDVAVRQRFTVAHEVAHYLLHRSQIGTDGITDSILYRSKLSDRTEAEANKLGAALLLPWRKVNEWHQARFGTSPTAEHIDDIANEFRVSRLAVGFRLGF